MIEIIKTQQDQVNILPKVATTSVLGLKTNTLKELIQANTIYSRLITKRYNQKLKSTRKANIHQEVIFTLTPIVLVSLTNNTKQV